MKLKEQQEARKLRKQGLSIREICDRLSVAKSSVSLWVRDIKLTDEQIDALNQKMLLSRVRFGYLSICGGANRNKEEAEKRHKDFEQAGFERARTDEEFRLVCALYWGEGLKSNKGAFRVTNCDPTLLRLILNWLIVSGFGERVKLRIQYHAENGISEEEVKDWWLAQLPDLKEEQIGKLTKCKINRVSQEKGIGKKALRHRERRSLSNRAILQRAGRHKLPERAGDW